MLVSETQERELDKMWAPHQFSADYGAVQDTRLNSYIHGVGRNIARKTHRQGMPYSFRALNTVVVNGYTFPAGSIGLARGILLAMEDEAQLAAVLGHELGHVNARHAGARMTKNMLAMFAVAVVAAYVQHEREEYADLAAGLGSVGANMLLARYSRGNEREADALGMEYATKAGHNARGMIGLMDVFRKLRKTKPNAVDLLFSTHPMSDERYDTAAERARKKYAHAAGLPSNRERYMDNTAGLRAMRGAIEKLQNGEKAMRMKKFAQARSEFAGALRTAPDDYAALLMMAKASLALEKADDARRYARKARNVYPQEPQAHHVSGMAEMTRGKFDAALAEFNAYESKLPGNPNTVFFKGYCQEKMGRKSESAREYARYLEVAPSGEYAGHARKRLVEWGYIRAAGGGA